jgi:hypothetical protein
MNLRRWGFSWGVVLSWSGMASFTLVGGALFIVDGTIRAPQGGPPGPVPAPWWQRHLRWLVAGGVPLVIALAMTAVNLPPILMRHDDGGRGARLIAADGIRLVRAPAARVELAAAMGRLSFMGARAHDVGGAARQGNAALESRRPAHLLVDVGAVAQRRVARELPGVRLTPADGLRQPAARVPVHQGAGQVTGCRRACPR